MNREAGLRQRGTTYSQGRVQIIREESMKLVRCAILLSLVHPSQCMSIVSRLQDIFTMHLDYLRTDYPFYHYSGLFP